MRGGTLGVLFYEVSEIGKQFFDDKMDWSKLLEADWSLMDGRSQLQDDDSSNDSILLESKPAAKQSPSKKSIASSLIDLSRETKTKKRKSPASTKKKGSAEETPAKGSEQSTTI